jgi:crotonobetaine/carnitine-CoA ligase
MSSPTLSPQAVAEFQFAGQDVPWLLNHWSASKPEQDFLIWEPKSGEHQRWNYRQFNEATLAVAAGLMSKGVSKGDKVLIHCENCPEMVIAWYACAQIGAVAVTTNTRSAGPEIAYFASHAECVGAITQPQFSAILTEYATELNWLVVTEDNSGEPAAAEQTESSTQKFSSLYLKPDDVPKREAEPMLPVGILYTSGTTSRPKAVVHTHANCLWAGRQGSVNLDLRGDDAYLVYLPFFHVNAQSWSIWSVLGVGASIVLQPKFSASRFWEVIAKHSITHIALIPFVFKAIGAQPVPENHSVRVGQFGLIMPEIDGWLNLRTTASFGMTETVTQVTCNNFAQSYPSGSMGKAALGYELLVIDQETNELCQQGEVGELYVRGTRGIQLFLEYYRNEEATNNAFTEDGWFKTGDLVRLGESGNLFYRDRDKDALKVGGENVSAREVEDCCRQVPGIDNIAVVGKAHDMLDMVPVACVVKGFGAPEDEEVFADQIIARCKENLADFKVPRAVYFMDDFPKATLDKVAKNKLRETVNEMPPVD